MKIQRPFNRKRAALLAFLMIGALLILSGIYIFSHDYSHGENPISDVTENRSQILLTGTGYSLNYEQEQQYRKEEAEREEILREHKEEIAKETGKSSNNRNEAQNDGGGENIIEGSSDDTSHGGDDGDPSQGSGDEGPGEDGDGDNTGGDEEESKLPTIICSLQDGQNISGNMLSFTVKGISYKNVVISSFDMNVLVNGNRVVSTGHNSDDSYSFKTSQYLRDGQNEVSITVKDKEGYMASKTYLVNVDIDGERPVIGTATVKMEARNIGRGILMNQQVTIYEGDSAYIVIDRALNEAGLAPNWKKGSSEFGGLYLAGVTVPGIFTNWSYDMIPDPVKDKLDELGASEMGVPDQTDYIGETDVYERSGWVYDIDGSGGAFSEDGMSVESVYDGDVITVAFTLHLGYEYNGVWWTYGNW